MLDVMEANELLEQVEMMSRTGEHSLMLHRLDSLPRVVIESTPDFIYLRADAMWRLGNYHEALGLIDSIADQVVYFGNSSLGRRHRNLHGVLMLELGHVGAAQQDFAEVAWMAHESGDVKGFAISSMNQGVTADVLCEWETALVSYNRAIAAFEDIGETTWISRCRHNMALTYRQLGKLDIARALFDQSYSEVSLNGGLNDILSLKSEMALLYEMAGDHELARKTAANALAAAESAVNPRRIAELLRVNAIIFRAESDARRAILLLRRGLTLARELGVTLLEAELLQELAACHLQLGMRRPALVNSNRAANAFRALGAERRAQAALQILETHAQAIN